MYNLIFVIMTLVKNNSSVYHYYMIFLKLIVLTSLVSSALLTGISLFNQVTLYPGFKNINESDFVAFHSSSYSSIRNLYLPLMTLEAISFIAMVFVGRYESLEWLLSAIFLVALWILTFVIFQRIHEKLNEGKEPKLIQEMIELNWFRVLAWAMKTLLLAFAIISDL